MQNIQPWAQRPEGYLFEPDMDSDEENSDVYVVNSNNSMAERIGNTAWYVCHYVHLVVYSVNCYNKMHEVYNCFLYIRAIPMLFGVLVRRV